MGLRIVAGSTCTRMMHMHTFAFAGVFCVPAHMPLSLQPTRPPSLPAISPLSPSPPYSAPPNLLVLPAPQPMSTEAQQAQLQASSPRGAEPWAGAADLHDTLQDEGAGQQGDPQAAGRNMVALSCFPRVPDAAESATASGSHIEAFMSLGVEIAPAKRGQASLSLARVSGDAGGAGSSVSPVLLSSVDVASSSQTGPEATGDAKAEGRNEAGEKLLHPLLQPPEQSFSVTPKSSPARSSASSRKPDSIGGGSHIDFEEFSQMTCNAAMER